MKTKNRGCASTPFGMLLILAAGSYWGSKYVDTSKISQFLSQNGVQLPSKALPSSSPVFLPVTLQSQPPAAAPIPKLTPAPSPPALPTPAPKQSSAAVTPWERKTIRGIYLSRYQVTNNATEQMIRDRVRYYHAQGINTIIQGVWGNGCTMYKSAVLQETFGYSSCPNQFQDQWLDWMIDEAKQQGMQVHAYFEKGIKIDKNSPIYQLAISRKWLVPGVDKTYAGIEQYVLDVEKPAVANLFLKISVEFVKKYPKINAVQWDDYLGYYAELPGNVDRTLRLTSFVQKMRGGVKQANPSVSFDLCHHNPYWGKRYFAADWENWQIDRVFIQAYNDTNFDQELAYAEQYAGVAILDKQLYRLKALVSNPKIKGILVFPSSGEPENTAAEIQKFTKIKS